jgi:hypothetical protein
LARLPAEIVEITRDFVCVRVVDMRPVDLTRFRFDFDLTFAALVADADGAVQHRYGGRDGKDAQSALSVASLGAFLRGSLEESKARAPKGAEPGGTSSPKPRTIEDLPEFKKREAQKKIDCVHCHNVNDFEHRQAEASGSWKREQMWVYPDPARLGLEVERDDQQKVARVDAGSAAAKAGIAVGDRLKRANGASLLTRADLQWTLHGLPFAKAKLDLEIERDGTTKTLSLALPDGWKAAPANEYAWRSYKWTLTPHPGFGGKTLSDDAKKKLGLKPSEFAMNVDYLVTWGDQQHTGQNAQKAGMRKDDVVLAVDGKSDFESNDHFQAWWRIAKKPGSMAEIVVLRDGKRQTIKMKVIE